MRKDINRKWPCSLQIFNAIILTEQGKGWDSSHADFPSEEISSRSDFALLSFGEKPCPLSPLRGFLTPIPHPVHIVVSISFFCHSRGGGNPVLIYYLYEIAALLSVARPVRFVISNGASNNVGLRFIAFFLTDKRINGQQISEAGCPLFTFHFLHFTFYKLYLI